MNELNTIYNHNLKNVSSDSNYKSFNDFIFSNDIKIIGKLLHRYDFFNKVKDLPGDIVEVGVFKGSGIATFSKFIEIYCPNSKKLSLLAMTCSQSKMIYQMKCQLLKIFLINSKA